MSYYSGQGRLFVAVRNADGTPMGFEPIGNVPSLELSIEITKFEHTESMSGSRATDVTIVQEKKGTFTMTMEDMAPANLALAMWGTQQTIASAVGATYNDMIAYLGKSSALPHAKVSNVVLKDVTDVTTYEFGTTIGTTTTPGLSLNGWVNQETGTVHVFTDAEQTARSATANITDLDPLHATYDHAANEVVHAFTDTSQQRWLRFEGLNTIDDTPVVIDIFKADLDPMSGYALINEEMASFEVTGSVLYDELQTGTSKFFRQVTAD